MPQTSNKAASLMRWYVRFTRFATTHLVRLQENENACGPTCVMMAHARMNRLTTITDGMATEQSMVDNVRGLVPGKAAWDPATQWTNAKDLETLINSFDIGKWASSDVGAANVAATIKQQAAFFQLSTVPILVHVDWGHWVMVDYTFGDYAVVCDPWDGNVHVTRLNTGGSTAYNNRSPALSWSIPPVWKTRKGGGTGAFSGWVVQCVGMDVTSRLGKIALGAGL